MNVLMFSPGYPAEMQHFTRGLAEVGANVIGLGDQPKASLPEIARAAVGDHIHARSLADEERVIRQVAEYARRVRIDRVECLWEPYMILAARLREMLELPGMTVEQTLPFRDKEIMKDVLDAAGIRTPRHGRGTTVAECREVAERVGFPLIVKPVAGAGSADTYRVDSGDELEAIFPALRHVPQVTIEEFIDGEDMTFDTVCVGGAVAHFNICRYWPRALESKTHEWLSPQTYALRDVEDPALASGREMGFAVLAALGFETGYTHMEWYRTSSGEVVFGEIAARPPGVRTVDLINYASDIDTYRGWAEAVVHARWTQPIERRFNSCWVIKRARGQGRIERIEGLASLLQEYGSWICDVDLLPVGAPRRNWKATLISDGMVFLRHPEIGTLEEIADAFATRLRMYAAQDVRTS
ncbi:MAG: ATP-grasp domain-containing protein [Gemmatimonadetes bacterium]|nr:ATP-grasp domain-containing protein [Gemmatimonadota bacterium]